MNKKKFISIALSIFLICGLSVKTAYASDDNGKIDLYQIFSNKADAMKTEVGSRIYKWSMHLPDDGIIYKSEQANSFSMSTDSYQSNIQLEIDKNKNNLTLEEYLYKLQHKPKNSFFWYDSDKEYSMSIERDGTGKRYIRIIKTDQSYDYYMVNEAAEESSNYMENRIYIENNYIYILTVSMKGEFYKEHQEMFDKLISSFKISFDEKNPYIKELSDSVSTQRKFTNASYGWQITLNPYWKADGIANARVQNFVPVYSDEELNIEDKDSKNDEEEKDKIKEGVTVNLVNSAVNGETAVSFGEKEFNDFKNNYNSKVYDILSCGKKIQNGLEMYSLVIRNKTITGKPYVIHNLYAVGNGYKYIISATMKDEKYNNAQKRSEFENMINSFTLSKSNLNKYLGKIVPAESLININDSKDFNLKKYTFGTKITKAWNILNNDDIDYDYNKKFIQENYNDNMKNNEFLSAAEPYSNISLDINAGLDASGINENIKKRAEALSKDNEVLMRLAKVTIESGNHDGAELYYVAKEYDLNSIFNFVQSDKTKTYNFENFKNKYSYIIKIGNNTYTECITIPLSRTTDANINKIHRTWSDTSINGINYSKCNISWKDHKLDEFITDK